MFQHNLNRVTQKLGLNWEISGFDYMQLESQSFNPECRKSCQPLVDTHWMICIEDLAVFLGSFS